jgi:hypothetical protein
MQNSPIAKPPPQQGGWVFIDHVPGFSQMMQHMQAAYNLIRNTLFSQSPGKTEIMRTSTRKALSGIMFSLPELFKDTISMVAEPFFSSNSGFFHKFSDPGEVGSLQFHVGASKW